MRGIFIADAHLRNETDDNYRSLLRFLSSLEGTVDTLYILGDLFEFWVGCRRMVYPHYLPMLDQLRNLAESGTRIVYFEGNHDFHLGVYFTDTIKAEVHPGPATIILDGKRLFICHGDQINSRDYRYRALRTILHSRLARILIGMVPVALTCAIAEGMSRKSSQKHDTRRSRWDYAGMIRHFASERFQEGADVVICGHFHLPLLETISSEKGGTLLSVGDWIGQFSYAEWLDGRLSLKTFR